MNNPADNVVHRTLDCGLELAVMALPDRKVAALDVRIHGGFAFERPECLGVAHVLDEAISKGTERYTGQQLNDAFDAIGAAHDSHAGRECMAFSCLCLPEYLPQAIELHTEMIRRPTFPADACAVAIELSQQSFSALEDDPFELAKRLLHQQAYSDPLGRHALGEESTLQQLDRERIVQHWRENFAAGRMQVTVAGAVDADQIAELLEKEFCGFGPADRVRSDFGLRFTPGTHHHAKELEQEQVAICFPGSAVVDADYSIERVTLGILAGGMSGRLFTEVREKQGLVYWVGAWADRPRTGGMVHLGASSTPENVERTYTTLLREITRLGEDLTESELQRAITGIVTRTQTQGDVTRARAGEMADDLFYLGRVVPMEEKLARVQAVTIKDVCDYLHRHPRDARAVVTVGPKQMHG